MGLRFTSREQVVALYDSVTDWAFGPVFHTEEAAQRFLDWTEEKGVWRGDVRQVPIGQLAEMWERYSAETEDSRG